MRTKKDIEHSLAAAGSYGHATPTAWGAMLAVLHDLVDRLPDDEQRESIPVPVPDARRGDVAQEMGYRLRTVATYYQMCGKHGEVADPEFIAREIQGATDRVLAMLPAPPAEHLTFGGERCVYCGANCLDVVQCEVADPGERRVRFMRALGEFRDHFANIAQGEPR